LLGRSGGGTRTRRCGAVGATDGGGGLNEHSGWAPSGASAIYRGNLMIATKVAEANICNMMHIKIRYFLNATKLFASAAGFWSRWVQQSSTSTDFGFTLNQIKTIQPRLQPSDEYFFAKPARIRGVIPAGRPTVGRQPPLRR